MIMKKILLLLFAIHCSPFTAVAQKLVVSQAKVNAGRTGFMQPITATFELSNKSRRRLVIESVKPDCGCTAVEYPREVGANERFPQTRLSDNAGRRRAGSARLYR